MSRTEEAPEKASWVLANTDPELEAFAAEVGSDGPIVVEGARTRWPAHWQPPADARVVRAPVGIVEHKPEEMLVTVRAGTRVDDLVAMLARVGQRVPLAPGGTVGGAVAVGRNCLQRLGRGSVRDAVMQVRYVSAEGRLVAGGGPVVKNVSGFNLPKLLTGSHGTLGVICEVILRTNPVPARTELVSVQGADPFVVFGSLLSVIKVNDLFFEIGKAAGRIFSGVPGQTAVISSSPRALGRTCRATSTTSAS